MSTDIFCMFADLNYSESVFQATVADILLSYICCDGMTICGNHSNDVNELLRL